MPRREETVRIGSHDLKLTNLDKVLYPETGTTKREVVRYYQEIAPILLPHIRNHPMTFKRYPNGVDGEFFFEKQCSRYRPDWVEVAPIQTKTKQINFCLLNDVETLVWAANLAAIELHPSLAVADNYDQPKVLAFDLDPGPPANVIDCCHVALLMREVLGDLGLESFVKTSGGKGLHCYVPLNTPVNFTQTKSFAHAVANLFERHHPNDATSIMKKELRGGKIFIDWSQNDRSKTTVSVYSMRARSHPTVSTPVSWMEIEKAWRKKDAGLLTFEYDEVLRRVDRMGDLFDAMLKMKQTLPSAGEEQLAA